MKKRSDDLLELEYSPKAAQQSAQRTPKIEARRQAERTAPASKQTIEQLAAVWGAKVRRK